MMAKQPTIDDGHRCRSPRQLRNCPLLEFPDNRATSRDGYYVTMIARIAAVKSPNQPALTRSTPLG